MCGRLVLIGPSEPRSPGDLEEDPPSLNRPIRTLQESALRYLSCVELVSDLEFVF